MIPLALLQRQALEVVTRTGSLGRRVPCHGLSVSALIVKNDRRQRRPRRYLAGGPLPASLPILDRFRCPCPAKGARSTSGRVVHRIACNLTPRPSDLPSGLLDSSLLGHRL